MDEKGRGSITKIKRKDVKSKLKRRKEKEEKITRVPKKKTKYWLGV